jgi:PTS system nitrogen regulatory IIA component
MDLADILSEESVLICTDVTSKRDLLSRLATIVAEQSGQPAQDIFDALNNREALGSTGLGNGIAVPHGKLAGLKNVIAVFVKLTNPVDFEAVDDQPVGAGADHLKALARVARVLRTDSVVDRLRRATEPAKLRAILTQPLEATKAA